jgi:hypothetical protein
MTSNDTPHTVQDVTMTRALTDRTVKDISNAAELEAEEARDNTKHELPQRSGEPRFGPRAYYYAASRSGVVPSWVASAH